MPIEASPTLAVTMFKAAASLIGICIATLAILSGLLAREKATPKPLHLHKEGPGSPLLRKEFATVMLEIEVRSLFFRLKTSIGLFGGCLVTSLLWLLLIESPRCQNQVLASPLLHSLAYSLTLLSVVTFVLAFLTMLSIIFSIKFEYLSGDHGNG